MNELYHYGIKGMRWGVRRYQNADGSYTSSGKNRYRTNSVHRQKLEAKYRAEGMSTAEARSAADKRIRTEKIVAVTAGLTVATVATIVAKKKYDDYVKDQLINSGDILKRIDDNNGMNLHGRYYAVLGKNKTDVEKYEGTFARMITSNPRRGNTAYQKTIRANDKLRIASDKSAKRVLQQLYDDDSSFRRAAPDGFVNKRGKVTNSAYKRFNVGLARESKESAKYYSYLRKNGYDALRDVNDRGYYSVFNAKNPIIVFNSGKTMVGSVREIPVSEMNAKATKYGMRQVARLLGPNAAIGGAAATYGVVQRSRNKKKAVTRYE